MNWSRTGAPKAHHQLLVNTVLKRSHCVSEEAEGMKGKGKLIRTLGAKEREGFQKEKENQTHKQVQ